jgi:hypothetical protein
VLGGYRCQFLREGGALGLDIRLVAFLGVQRLLLAGEAVPVQDARNGRKMTRHPEPVPQFHERGVGLLADEFQEGSDGGRVECRSGAPSVGLGQDRSGGTTALQQPRQEGQADREQVSDLAEREFLAVNSGNDAFTEIVGVRTHVTPPSQDAPQVVLFPLLSVCKPL